MRAALIAKKELEMYINDVWIDLSKMTIKEAAVKARVNIETLKRLIKQQAAERKAERAKNQLNYPPLTKRDSKPPRPKRGLRHGEL
mgnify:FL=1